MSQFFQIHPETPQKRLIRQATDIIRSGGVVAYPTDSAYALGCHIGDKNALDRIRRIRKLDDQQKSIGKTGAKLYLRADRAAPVLAVKKVAKAAGAGGVFAVVRLARKRAPDGDAQER